MKAIKHQCQKYGMACVSACAAMLTGVSVEDVYKEFDKDYHSHTKTLTDYLGEKGVTLQPASPHIQAGSKLHSGYVYVVTVPALMQEGYFHQIILDLRWYEYENRIRVYDPAKGMPGNRYYSHNAKECANDPLAFYIRSWIVDAIVVKAPELEINVYE
jgi:hypothetical protein